MIEKRRILDAAAGSRIDLAEGHMVISMRVTAMHRTGGAASRYGGPCPRTSTVFRHYIQQGYSRCHCLFHRDHPTLRLPRLKDARL